VNLDGKALEPVPLTSKFYYCFVDDPMWANVYMQVLIGATIPPFAIHAKTITSKSAVEVLDAWRKDCKANGAPLLWDTALFRLYLSEKGEPMVREVDFRSPGQGIQTLDYKNDS
jgi:hypothetical protein